MSHNYQLIIAFLIGIIAGLGIEFIRVVFDAIRDPDWFESKYHEIAQSAREMRKRIGKE